MTTREIYFKAMLLTDNHIGRIDYTYRDQNGDPQLGKSVCVKFHTHESVVEKSLTSMQEIEDIDGFMFWNISLLGEEFFKKHNIVITPIDSSRTE